MRKFAAVVLLFSLLAVSPEVSSAQTRPRRVGQTTMPAPSARTAPAARPTPLPQAAGTTARRTEKAERLPEEVAEEIGEDEVVRVNTALVTIPVSILDRDGRFISNLRKEDFRIFEDGTEQEVAYFAAVEQPFTVALIIDTSNSTRFKIEDIQDAAIAFLDQLRPEDRVLVVSFDDEIRFLSEATSDRRQLRDAIRRTRNAGGTKLYEAVDLVIKQRLDRIKGRKAIVLFTDGVDTTSKRASYQSTLGDAEELDALIYPIQYDTTNGGAQASVSWPQPRRSGGRRKVGLADILAGIIIGGGAGGGGGSSGGGGGGGGGGSTDEEYRRGGEYLRRLATLTGGRHYQADDIRNVGQAFNNIAEELRRQYSLGYYPARTSQSSERRQLKVRVKRPNLVVRARDSYVYQPTGSSFTARQADVPNAPAPPELRRRQLTR